ncbi:hypothetical protein PR001_g18267 [Phytophthora rubi]|nr:hypothetical protein PR001_g18267 [Phytophthora rubi]
MMVDADDGTTGVFLSKPASKQHLLISSTVDTVKNGTVSIVVLNGEGRREKLLAREAFDTWIPTNVDIPIVSPHAELERDRVPNWVAPLKERRCSSIAERGKA